MTDEEFNACSALLTMSEKKLLFSLIYAQQSTAVLEIGTWSGGSARIIVAALRAAGRNGKLACVDLTFDKVSEETRAFIKDDCYFIEGDCRSVIPLAYKKMGRPFNFVFIDGDHSTEFAYADTMNSIPFLASEAYLLYHDCYNPPTAEAIRMALRDDSRLIDCGIISHSPVEVDGRLYHGLRLVRFVKQRAY